MIITTIGTIANAAASGRLLAMLRVDDVADELRRCETSAGVMKSPRVSEKVKIEPATTAGKASGRITRRKVVHGVAPEVLGGAQTASPGSAPARRRSG